MPSPADERTADVNAAEALFEEFLARHDDPDHPAFGRLCDAHPGEAAGLRQLADDWARMAHVVDALGGDSSSDAAAPDDGDVPPTLAIDTRGSSSGSFARDESVSVQTVLERLDDEASGFQRYRVRREIDHGGMGRILRVWDGTLRRPLAMKVMLEGTGAADGRAAADERKLSRFLDEAQITGQLDHPGIVPVHELGLDDQGHLYFTMRLVRGRSLRTIFELVADRREGWTRARALGVILKVCEALAYAHSKRVVHRDIKPANVMVGRFGETYVMDWGLAKVMGTEEEPAPSSAPDDGSLDEVVTDRAELERHTPESPLMTVDGTVVGTPAYMSPEQAEGRLDDVGPQSDVYAVGALLYHLMSGRMPYVEPGERGRPRSVLEAVRKGPPQALDAIAADVPPELVAISERAMARKPGDRYQDMLEMAEELRAYLEGRVVRSYEQGAWAELRMWIVRNKTTSIVAFVALLFLALALGWALFERDLALSREGTERLARQRAEDAEQDARDAQQVALDNERAARDAQASAVSAKGVAEQARAAEAAAADRVRSTSYMAFVSAAGSHLRHRELEAARRMLEDCPPELRGWEWHLLDLRRDSSLARLHGHRGAVTELAFTPGGGLLASAGRDGTVNTWDATSFDSLSTLDLDEGLAEALAVHPDGRMLAVAVSSWGRSSTIRRFDVSTGDELAPLIFADDGGDETVTALAFDPAGRKLYAATDERRIVWWSLDDPRPRAFPRLHTGRITSLSFDPTGLRLVSGSEDRRAIVWEVEQGLQEIDLGPHDGAVLTVAHGPVPNRIATGSDDGLVRIFDLDRGDRPLFVLDGHDGPVTSVAFTPDGGRLVSGSTDRTVRVWDAWTGESLAELLGHEGPVRAVTTSDSGQLLASASDDGSVRLWDPTFLGARVVLEGHVEAVVSLAVPGHGDLVATSSYDGTTRLWDVASQLSVSSRDLPAPLPAALAFSVNGSRLAVGEPSPRSGEAHAIAVWDTSLGRFPEEHSLRLAGHDERIAALAFSPEGRRVASGSTDGTVVVWDAGSGARVDGHSRHGGWVLSLAFHPSAPLLASGGSDDTVVLHDLSGGDAGWRLDDLQAPAQALEFSPDGTQLALGTGRDVRLIDMTTRQELLLRGHQDDLLDLTWHPRQARLATSSRDGTVRLWDTDTGMTLVTLRPSAPALSVAFDAAGERLLTTEGNTLVSWETAPPSRTWSERRARAEVTGQAQDTFKRLIDQLVDPREVVAALEQDLELPIAVRGEALRLASNFGQDPWRLAESAWAVLVDRGATPNERAAALRRARAAAELAPDEPRLMSVLALAWHRAGDPVAAITWAEAADARNRRAPTYPQSWDLFVLSLAHRALGARTLASTYLDAGLAEQQADGMNDSVADALATEARDSLR
jgi:WD40 repeat protein/serine/threonine protein kinase